MTFLASRILFLTAIFCFGGMLASCDGDKIVYADVKHLLYVYDETRYSADDAMFVYSPLTGNAVPDELTGTSIAVVISKWQALFIAYDLSHGELPVADGVFNLAPRRWRVGRRLATIHMGVVAACAIGALAAMRVYHVLIARQRERKGLCRCGYDLRGNVSVQCPECGRIATENREV